MRPSVLLLVLACAVATLTVAVLAMPSAPVEIAIVTWLLLGAAGIVDWVFSPGARHFTVEVNAPAEIFSGEEGIVALRLKSRDGVRPVPQAAGRLRWPDGVAGPVGFMLLPESREIASVALPARGLRRGKWRLLSVSTLRKSRLGLLDLIGNHPLDVEIAVVPNVRSITAGEVDTQLAATEFGAKAASIHGEGSEFHQLREFVAGMDTRMIDYKRSARHGALVARQMQAERNHSIVLALDNGHLMREPINGLAKIDHMINASLALAWAGIQSGDRVGLFSFDARPRLFVPPMEGRRAFAQMRSHTASLEYRLVETNHTLALSHLHQRLSRRSLVIVFSDFVDTTTAELLIENMQVLNRHHVVVFVSLRDPLLEAYRRKPVNSLNMVSEIVAAADLERERKRVLDKLSRLGVFVIETAPGGLRPELISTYLSIRSRELI
ncbi:DUF58 domain-containing protein [Martelella endophytica]|uniref:DUF58 domain-containing protein n=1 Tax=Martelella endophytica TaxID=1486262 RepID=A0A0D5LQI8_MAREN|nr:DUF58 domain-containing protein [Martelella endophytica]AJY45608.1 hypothetical protein TM49_07835 [Martelella endophytica]